MGMRRGGGGVRGRPQQLTHPSRRVGRGGGERRGGEHKTGEGRGLITLSRAYGADRMLSCEGKGEEGDEFWTDVDETDRPLVSAGGGVDGEGDAQP